MILVAVTIVELVVSIGKNETRAIVEFRRDGIALATVLFIVTYCKLVTRRDLAIALGIYTAATVVVFTGRSMGVLHSYVAGVSDPFDILTYRRLDHEALVPGFFSIVCLSLALVPERGTRQLYYAAAGIASLVLFFASLQRTMSIAVVVGICSLAALLSKSKLLGVRQNVAIFVGAVVGVGALAFAFQHSKELQLLVNTGMADQNTFAWRIAGWQTLLGRMGLQDYIFGSGYGAELGRWTTSGYVYVGAHDFYVEKIWQLGVFGLLLYLLLWTQITGRLVTVLRNGETKNHKASAALYLALIAAILVFCISYSYNATAATYIVFGCAQAFIRTTVTRRSKNARALSFAAIQGLRKTPMTPVKPQLSGRIGREWGSGANRVGHSDFGDL